MRPRTASLGTALIVVAAAVTTMAATSTTAGGRAASIQATGSLPDGGSWVADMPAQWNGTVLLYSHGFGSLTAQDAPDPATARCQR